ncbi:hypothetical protein HDU87_006370 [Geranomyces variabilis]|uniref:Uncharacterized protein n=1 Tax=Geranomyces variabilis TaxID=109894 RepID=A0AAD5TI43_9FUNG|nr:hypothetical protein HDU87_006370 [Geranomyces variabilis]
MRIKGRWKKVEQPAGAAEGRSVWPSARFGHRCEAVEYYVPRNPKIPPPEGDPPTSGTAEVNGSAEREWLKSAEADLVTKMVLPWGGCDKEFVLHDAFEFDPVTSKWKQPALRVKGEHGVDSEPRADRLLEGCTPVPTAFAAVAVRGPFTYLFGGVSHGEHWENQLLEYDTRTYTITVLTEGDSSPPPCVGATLTFIPPSAASPVASLFLFGGRTADGALLNDAYLFNLETGEWSEVGNDAPTPRVAHTATLWPATQDKTHKVVIYGGTAKDGDGVRALDDVVFFNIDYRKWEYPRIQGDIPPGRSKHTAVFWADRMVVFGGDEGSCGHTKTPVFSQRTFLFNIETLTWEILDLIEETASDGNTRREPMAPAARANHSAAMLGNSMYVCMGQLDNASQFWGQTTGINLASDVWRLELGPPLFPQLVSMTRRSGPSPKLNFRWRYNSGGDRSCAFQLRLRVSNDTPDWQFMDIPAGKTSYTVDYIVLPGGMIHDVAPDEKYDWQLDAINWAGNSCMWSDPSQKDPAQRRGSRSEPLPKQPIELHCVQCIPAELVPFDKAFADRDVQENLVDILLLSWNAARGEPYRVQLSFSIFPAPIPRDPSEDTYKRQRVDGTDFRRIPIRRNYAPARAGAVTWHTVWEGRGCRWKGAVDSLHALVARAERQARGLSSPGKRSRDDLYDEFATPVVIRYAFRVGRTTAEGKMLDVSRVSDGMDFTVVLNEVPYQSAPVSPDVRRTSLGPRPVGEAVNGQHAKAAPADDEDDDAPLTTRVSQRAGTHSTVMTRDEGKQSADFDVQDDTPSLVYESPEEDDDEEEEEEEEEEILISVTVAQREQISAVDSSRSSSSRGTGRKRKPSQRSLANLRDGDEDYIPPLKPPSRKASLLRLPLSETATPRASSKRARASGNTSRQQSQSPTRESPAGKKKSPSTSGQRAQKEKPATSDVDIEGSSSAASSRAQTPRHGGRSAKPLSASHGTTTSSLATISEPEPDFGSLALDPETSRPLLDDPRNGFHFNLRFGDRVDVSSDKEAVAKFLWYRARVVHYAPTADGKSWRVKIHYEGYTKKFDEYFPLIPGWIARVRPRRNGNGGEEDQEDAVIIGDMIVEDETVWDVHGPGKVYAITKAERETAKAGRCVVKFVGRKSMGP